MDLQQREARAALHAAEREVARAEARAAEAGRALDAARWEAGKCRGRLALLMMKELRV